MNQGLGDTTDREQWGLQSMLDKVIGKEKQEKAEKAEKAEKVEGWSLKTLFGVGKKWRGSSTKPYRPRTIEFSKLGLL